MLRGIAALGVCLMHFSGTINFPFLQDIGKFGGYGVPLFFVISGFIIPYSLHHNGYRIKNYFQFLLKRIIRIDPPYLITIGAIILLSFLAQYSPHHTSSVIDFLSYNTLFHFFYLVDVLDGAWMSPVFWTLAIEFQFYLLIGLLFPLLQAAKIPFQIASVLISGAIPFLLPDDAYISYYLLMFLPGIILYWHKTQPTALALFLTLQLAVAAAGYFCYGWQGLFCPLIAVGFILFVEKPIKPLMFLGTISYSLYLIHTPFGTDGLINFLQNYITSDAGRLCLTLIALPITIMAAWVFYRLVEKPSKRFADKISF